MPVAVPPPLHLVGRGYLTWTPWMGGMSLLLTQAFFGSWSCGRPGWGESQVGQTLSMAPWGEVSAIHSQLGGLPPCVADLSGHIAVVGKSVFDGSFCQIRFEGVGGYTLAVRCTALMDTWSDVLLLILPAARTVELCGAEPSLGPVGFLSSSSPSLSSWVLAVSSLMASPGFEVCMTCASSPSVVTGVAAVPFAVCSPSLSSLSGVLRISHHNHSLDLCHHHRILLRGCPSLF